LKDITVHREKGINTMDKYRVFISYSHADKTFADRIVRILEENLLTAIYDRHIQVGHRFDEDIKKYIAMSHVFVPILTEASSKRGWVHEEIGYAMALNIPVLPIVIEDQQPEMMLQMIQSVVIDKDLKDAKEKLSHQIFEDLLYDCKQEQCTYLCCRQVEERALYMANYADDIRKLGFHALLRQMGGLSTFQLPNEEISSRIWDERYYPNAKNEHHCERQLLERRALGKHAEVAGCKLIINPAIINSKKFSKTARVARLRTFRDFLVDMSDDKVEVVIDTNLAFNESVTLLGDWFAAESYFRLETQGFKYTMFTRYAPGIRGKIEVFDNEFTALMAANGCMPGETRRKTIDLLDAILDEINREG
jgi:hypothetical protein